MSRTPPVIETPIMVTSSAAPISARAWSMCITSPPTRLPAPEAVTEVSRTTSITSKSAGSFSNTTRTVSPRPASISAASRSVM